MSFTIYLETVHSKQEVMVHLWDPAGDVRDIKGKTDDSLHFSFTVDMETTDQRNINFKFWYPGEDVIWEKDAYTRRVPAQNFGSIWTYEFSPRCLTVDPTGSTVPEINFHVITREKFSGGQVYIWRPGGSETKMIPETARENDKNLSHFSVQVEQWMSGGFHFKLISRNGEYEPERSNRVWRPSDGSEVWIKSGQYDLHSLMPPMKDAVIQLIYPASARETPALHVHDDADDFSEKFSASEIADIDPDFRIAQYAFSVYPGAAYRLYAPGTGKSNLLDLPFSLSDDAPSSNLFYAILGVHALYGKLPVRNAHVWFIIYPNPGSCFGKQINLALRTGFAPTSRYDSTISIVKTLIAEKTQEGVWQAETMVFPGVPHWIDKLTSLEGIIEGCPEEQNRLEIQTGKNSRSDVFLSQRNIIARAGQLTVLYTADGISGFTENGGPIFEDVSFSKRTELMSHAFNKAIVNNGVFSPWEMPQGAIFTDYELWFVLYAPHAVSVDVVILDPGSQSPRQRNVKKFSMKLTNDLRYYWLNIPKTEFPDIQNIRYRFLLNNTQEVLDPASRQVTHADFLWADASEGPEGAWSVALDKKRIKDRFKDSGWRTPSWESFIIYELHPLRFTACNRDQINLAPPDRRKAFQRICYELRPGEYLSNLRTTVLEFLPVNEFPKDVSWGYNPAIPFAIESGYGGSFDFADCVWAAHDMEKCVMLDLVFNHLTESPLQAVAPDIYTDGETQWGSMVNYGHPVVIEYFRQALIYLWDAFNLDGFRFDATEAIVNGHINNGYIVRDGKTGSGFGWEFLGILYRALHKAADACGRPWPYQVAENDPDNWGLNGHVVDGQWDFRLQYSLGEAAINQIDKSASIKDILNSHFNIWETVRYAESHDAVSGQEPWKQRMVKREKWGKGMLMAKSVGTLAILAKGIPMLFMGEEAGESSQFRFSMDDIGGSNGHLDLQRYTNPATENNKILTWFNHILGLRRNRSNGFGWNDTPYVGWGNKTVAFTRADGSFFVIITFGTCNIRQNLGWLGLPANSEYKEIFNSSWRAYQVSFENERSNGGYEARLTSSSIVNLPEIGAVILERRL